MCVFNGTAIAGGYILGVCHDFRIMHESVGKICLSELKIGLPLSPPYMEAIAAKLTPAVVAQMSYGISYRQKEALKAKLIDSTYTNMIDLQEQLANFVDRYAEVGKNRRGIQYNKIN